MASGKKYAGQCDEAYPDVYTKVPPQPKVKKSGQLTPEQVATFYEDGFLLVENFFDPKELNPAKVDISETVDDLANRLYKADKIKQLYKDYGLYQRLTMLENDFPGASVLIFKNKHKPDGLKQSYKDIWTNERLLNVMEQLLGTGDIMGHPAAWNLRPKTPNINATEVPWHQDNAYLDNDSYKHMMVVAWIPMLDANEQNGCMEMMRGGHRTGKMATHTVCWRDTHYVMLPEEEMEKTLGCDIKKDRVIVPVPYGGMALLNNMVPHRGLPNVSNDVRWSLDLRWQSADTTIGFGGKLNGVLMRSSKDANLKIDWDSYTKQPRRSYKVEEDEFNTFEHGIWMERWPVVNENRHVKYYKQIQQQLTASS